ncbi:MAG: GNAT family N-acetyltransferase [Desulfobacteraceae bacterium]|nr:GNAT family N-acetyltransferase [Desulfobacteraceae bacterium]
MRIEYMDYLPDSYRAPAARLYLSALRDKLGPVLGYGYRAQMIIAEHIRTDNCIAAVSARELIGILGIKAGKHGFFNPTIRVLCKKFGVIGGFFSILGLMLLDHRTGAGEWHVDGVAVADHMRNRHIGTTLFNRLEIKARHHGIRRLSLGVINTNHRARILYERLGYMNVRQDSIKPFNTIFRFNFDSASIMEKKM